MSKPPTETCYMCDAVATSPEHVPPKFYYPKRRDLLATYFGPAKYRRQFFIKNFRDNLITVPSCKIHNEAKSKDDEYVAALLVATLEDSDVAAAHLLGAAGRAIQRSSVFAQVFNTARPIRREDGSQAVGLTIDHSRFDSAIQSMARGLYFHETKTRLLGACTSMTSFLRLQDGKRAQSGTQADALSKLVAQLEAAGVDAVQHRGPHPEVFYYQVMHPDAAKPATAIVRMVFYGSIEWYVVRRAP